MEACKSTKYNFHDFVDFAVADTEPAAALHLASDWLQRHLQGP